MRGGLRVVAALAGLAAVAAGLFALASGEDVSPGAPSPRAEQVGATVPAEPARPAVASAPAWSPVVAATATPPASPTPTGETLVSSTPTSGPGSAEYQALVESRLTRRLQGAHTLQIDGADLEIIGTQLPREGRHHEPYLAVRNLRTGEVAYWQSGLRFSLQGGVDPETFIAQQTDMRRLFVGGGIAEVAVDAALVSGVYARLSADPRVAGVRLLPIPVQPTLR